MAHNSQHSAEKPHLHGMILVKKPDQITSHDVVHKIRRILSISKVGHFGTLDPMATGLLLLAVGTATRLFPFFSKLDKAYTGEIKLGQSTDTYDAMGEPTSPLVSNWPDQPTLDRAMHAFEGVLFQIAPPFSAKKFKGRPLYRLARAKLPTPLTTSSVTVYSFRCSSYKAPLIWFETRCSSGTYIRSLAHDLGHKLGCGAHLSSLQRTEVGRFRIEQAHTLEYISQSMDAGEVANFLHPIEELLPEFPKLILTEPGTTLAQNGNHIFPQHIAKVGKAEALTQETRSRIPPEIFRLFSPQGRLVAYARKISLDSGLHPYLVIDRGDSKQ